jgi:RNA polymerase sigma-70 factor, ECF subfamily
MSADPRESGPESARRGEPVPLTPAHALLPLVYDELRALAAARFAAEPAGHTLQPTALVHEVYLKLAQQTRAQFNDSAHFFAVAAEAIRRVLVDHSRRRGAAKRDLPGPRVTINSDLDAPAAPQQEIDLLALDDALTRLATLSPRQARVVELRFFGGMEVPDVARILGVSEGTVKGDWRLARAWLERELAAGGAGEGDGAGGGVVA